MTTLPRSGISGRCVRTSSSSESFPSSTSSMIAKAVNCFDVEPMFVGVAAVKGTS